jgi:hypothetical protein
VSFGAGSGSQHAIGTGVIGGMMSASILGVFFIPLFYLWIKSVIQGKPHPDSVISATSTSGHSPAHETLDNEK